MLRPLRLVLLPPALAALLCAPPLLAQAVEGTVVEQASGQPVAGAVVHLLGAEERIWRSALTDDAGGFALPAPQAGAYRVRAERVGHQSTTSERLEIGPGETRRLLLELSAQPVTLEGITVEVRGRGCRVRPQSAVATARVWDEARKALSAVSLSQAAERLRFDVQVTRRQMNARGEMLGQERNAAYGRAGSPFRSISVEELAEHGYRRTFPDSVLYYAPDAWVLLSDAFLDGHCFTLRDGGQERPDQIGLEFRPAGRSSLVDVEGVLWLDRASAMLRAVDYRFVGLPRYIPAGRFGGRVEFERLLPSGTWIVRRWHIQMPVVTARGFSGTLGVTGEAMRPQYTLGGIIEEGGEVTDVYSAGERPAGAGELEGVVMDGLSQRPLEGARVYLSGTGFSTETDAQGHYRLTGVPAGRYVVSFTHPRLTALGIIPDPARAVLAAGGRERVDLAVPTREMVLARYCEQEGAGMVAGHVRDASGGALAGARVLAEWQEPVPGETTQRFRREGDGSIVSADGRPTMIRSTKRSVQVRTDAMGFYRICGAPPSTTVLLTADAGAGGKGLLRVRTGEDGLAPADVSVHLGEPR